MQHSSHPEPDDFWVKLSPTNWDDPAFRAAAMGTIYRPMPDWPDDWRSDVPSEKPKNLPQEDPPVPPETWPGL